MISLLVSFSYLFHSFLFSLVSDFFLFLTYLFLLVFSSPILGALLKDYYYYPIATEPASSVIQARKVMTSYDLEPLSPRMHTSKNIFVVIFFTVR